MDDLIQQTVAKIGQEDEVLEQYRLEDIVIFEVGTKWNGRRVITYEPYVLLSGELHRAKCMETLDGALISAIAHKYSHTVISDRAAELTELMGTADLVVG